MKSIARLRPMLVLLAAACLGLAALAQDRSAAEHLQTIVWPREEHELGGFSGLTMSPDGSRFLAVTDRGHRVEGTLHREDGRITGVRGVSVNKLRNTEGETARTHNVDSEGIAVGPDGTIFIAFEGDHRIWAYPPGQAAAQGVDVPAAFSDFSGNRGLEALAVDPDGTLYTMAEQSARWFGDFTVWRRTSQGWDDRLTLPRRGLLFLPVGAEIGPDGRLYVLERAFLGIGFRSRVRRFTVGSDSLEDETVLLTSTLRRHDNLEGLAVWRDGTGAIRLTMISDDNEFRLQETQFVEYRVQDALAPIDASR